jgi:hypothetical protein
MNKVEFIKVQAGGHFLRFIEILFGSADLCASQPFPLLLVLERR